MDLSVKVTNLDINMWEIVKSKYVKHTHLSNFNTKRMLFLRIISSIQRK
jgi:hypothetical protein